MRKVRSVGSGRMCGIEVTPKPGEPFEKMLRRFTRKVRDEGIIQEYMDRQSFEKPSQKKRRKRAQAASR